MSQRPFRRLEPALQFVDPEEAPTFATRTRKASAPHTEHPHHIPHPTASSLPQQSRSEFDPSLQPWVDEVPLLTELGLNSTVVKQRVLAVLIPKRNRAADDVDLLIPIVFFVLMMALQVLRPFPHFGYIYGLLVFASLAMTALLFCLQQQQVPLPVLTLFFQVLGAFGYGLLPIVLYSALSLIILKTTWLHILFAPLFGAWASSAATGLLCRFAKLETMYNLVLFPAFLFYFNLTSCLVS